MKTLELGRLRGEFWKPDFKRKQNGQQCRPGDLGCRPDVLEEAAEEDWPFKSFCMLE